jgi:hypothetical protein
MFGNHNSRSRKPDFPIRKPKFPMRQFPFPNSET